MKKINILFVCMGNICRSPLAHGLFQHMVEQEGLNEHIRIDSAGTHAYHVGEPPDLRMRQTAMQRGVDLSGQSARRFEVSDFEQFDYVLAMDSDNLSNLKSKCPPEYRDRLYLFMEFAPQVREREVPDPYYGGEAGFEHVYRLVEEAACGLLGHIRDRHL